MVAKLKFGVACISQESNTFAPFLSNIGDFSIEVGAGVISSSQGTNTEVGGFLKQLDELQIEAVPLVSAVAVPAGLVTDDTFETLVGLLLRQIKSNQFDGLLLALHGAWVSQSYGSADAELLKRVRRTIGPNLPIVITLDLHANVTPSLLENIQGLVGYRTYPHIDMAETGEKAATLLHELLTWGLHPRLYWLPIPFMAPPQRATTDRAPISEIIERLDADLPSSTVLSSSFFCVQPWLDMHEVSSALVVVAREENTAISNTLRSIAGELWNRLDELQVNWTSPEHLASQVIEEKSRPVIVSEAFDATAGGAAGDHPGLLSILLSHREFLSACLFMVDGETATCAASAGVGGNFHGLLGAKLDTRFGSSLHVDARVRYLSDGGFVFKGPVFTGRKVSMGLTAVLEIGRLKVVVASRSALVIDPELYRSQRIEPREQDIVAVKSPSLFRPGYASMLDRVIHLDMPGACRGNLPMMPFVNIKRPMAPFDHFPWNERDRVVQCFASPHR